MSENFEKIVLEKLEKIDKLESKIDKLESKVDKLESNQADIKEQLNNLIFEVKETQDVVKFNTSRIIELEHTFKDKINALFDARSINNDKHKEYENSINNLDSKVFNHDIRISVLEDKINPNNKVAED